MWTEGQTYTFLYPVIHLYCSIFNFLSCILNNYDSSASYLLWLAYNCAGLKHESLICKNLSYPPQIIQASEVKYFLLIQPLKKTFSILHSPFSPFLLSFINQNSTAIMQLLMLHNRVVKVPFFIIIWGTFKYFY